MTAAAQIILAGGIRQVAASFPAALGVALVFALAPCGALWWLKRGSVPVILPPAEDDLDVPDWVRPVPPGPVITHHDELIRRAREEDAAEALADFEREIEEMIREYGNG